MNMDLYPSKDEIFDKYVIQNLSSNEVMAYYQISKSTFFRIVKYYGIKKDKSLSAVLRQKTTKAKYGVDNVSQLDEIKKKKEASCLEHYGVTNSLKSQEIRNRISETNLDKYGSIAPAGNKAVVEKMQQTCLEKYGVKNPSLVEEFKEKRKQTHLLRFGVECNLSDKACQEQIKSTCLQKYGVPYFCMSRDCSGISHGSYSRANDQFADLLERHNIAYEREFVLNNYIYDFKIQNILIEINPTYTHSIDISYHNKRNAIAYDYHHCKTQNALVNGFLCVHVFDWMDSNIIVDNILTHTYSSCSLQEREIRTYFVDMRTKEARLISQEEAPAQLLKDGLVRVCDDGYDIILK